MKHWLPVLIIGMALQPLGAMPMPSVIGPAAPGPDQPAIAGGAWSMEMKVSGACILLGALCMIYGDSLARNGTKTDDTQAKSLVGCGSLLFMISSFWFIEAAWKPSPYPDPEDKDIKDANGDTPLHHLAKIRSYGEFKRLLAMGVEVNARNNQGETPLHIAVGWGPDGPDKVKRLLAEGADIEARDNNGMTPLHRAAAGVVVNSVIVLLEHGADINALDNAGRTPLDLAGFPYNGRTAETLRLNGGKTGAEVKAALSVPVPSDLAPPTP
jgi:hypothetical protein